LVERGKGGEVTAVENTAPRREALIEAQCTTRTCLLEVCISFDHRMQIEA